MKHIDVTIRFEDKLLLPLAQFLKRLQFDDVFQRSTSVEEAYQAINACELIRRALAEKGVNPR